MNENKTLSIVWADSLGSNLYFYHGINTAKLGFSTYKARKQIIKYLDEKKINQLVLDDGNTLDLFLKASQGLLIPSAIFEGKIIYKYIPK